MTSTSGLGMSYRYRLKNSFGMQVSYLPIFDKTQPNENDQVFGFSFLYTFYEGEKSNFYIYQGNTLWIIQEVSYRDTYNNYNGYYYTYSGYEEYTNNRNFINNSLGLGMEFLIQERGGLNLQIGLGGYNNFNTILPSGGISLFYKL